MNRNEMVINKVRTWLEENDKSYQWLANQIGVSKSLMGHILNGNRQFLPNRMIQVAEAMGITVEELITPEHKKEKPYTLQLRGKADSRITQDHLKNMMFAIEDYLRIQRANEFLGE
ncbi:DNA-binding protein [Bacillus sp. FJAT-27231]|uniref:helix-turn-helix transcriptional regulator n=1 Tax=Bacillus sp. FJAT-27231 TaxID=1679168 RepID=UPI00067106F1|nr:helix-turn-helix transcriptional regulator [Bacillus sp. FJAT-27231]KMY52539.1 DNA-binding protein [Bacillus sp. FJAT-27231]